MTTRQDLTGQRFGRLTVISLDPIRSKSGRARWFCKCDCGGQCVSEALNLRQGSTNSCGCYSRQRSSEAKTTHGLSKMPEYSPWKAMRKRCNNPNTESAHCYIGRGITVCDRWSDFTLFLEDMGPRPSPLHTIERRDNNKGYEPSNCYWATRAEQGVNTRRNIVLPDGSLLAQRIRESGIKPSIVYKRLRRGCSVERALTP